MTGKANLLEPGFAGALRPWARLLAGRNRMLSGRGRLFDSGVRILLLGLAYVVAARLGVVFALSGGNASTVWSPAGA